MTEDPQKIEELEALVKKLELDLMHDSLTGLFTRRHFTGEMNMYLSGISGPAAEKRREGIRHISILFCDIDNFKQINDTQGHDAGDKILKKVANVLRSGVRDTDIVCRWGGEEMIVGLPGANEDEAVIKAEKLRKEVEKSKVSVSIGVASFEPGIDFDELVKRSDRAMYLAKKEGKNSVRTYSQVSEKGGVA